MRILVRCRRSFRKQQLHTSHGLLQHEQTCGEVNLIWKSLVIVSTSPLRDLSLVHVLLRKGDTVRYVHTHTHTQCTHSYWPMQGDRQHDVTKTFPSKIVSESFLCPFLSRGGVPCAKIEVEKSKELTPLFLSSAAGAFTAPVRGVYYIRFTAAQPGLGYMGSYMSHSGAGGGRRGVHASPCELQAL